MSAEKMITPD